MRKTISNNNNVKLTPSTLINVLSFSAFCFASAANNALPVILNWAPDRVRYWRFSVRSAVKFSDGLMKSFCCSSARNKTQVILSWLTVSMPFSACHCTLPCCVCCAKRPKPSQSCSSESKLFRLNGLTMSSAYC